LDCAGQSNSDGTEEIIIPLGGEMDIGGLGGGGSTFEIPLDPAMMMPPQVHNDYLFCTRAELHFLPEIHKC
jgi:hypothetical protein